jgi:hypothetical protein
MNKYIAFFLCLSGPIFFSKVEAQTPKKSEIPTELETLVPIGDGFVLILLNDLERPSKMALRYFNEKEEVLGEKEINLKRQGLLTQFEGAFAFNGNLCVLTSLYYPGPQRNHLIFQRFKLPDFEELDAEIIDEAYSPEFFRIPFGYAKSPNEAYLSFYSWSYTLPEDPAKVSVRVYNKEFEEVWDQRYLLPFKNETLYIYDHAVNDEGRSFLFCENYRGNPGKYIDEEKVDFFILAADQGNENLIEYKLNLPDYTMTGLRAKMDTSGAIIGAAYLRDTDKKNRIGGLYMFKIPVDGKSIERSRLALTEDMYEAAYPYGEKESIFSANRHKFTDFSVDHIFVEPDGSWIITGEFRKEISSSYEIEFNDILALKVTPDRNSLIWLRRIPKRQTGLQGSWALYGYRAFQKKDNVFFLFNDTADNHDQEGNPKLLAGYEGGAARILLMQINTSGEIFKNDLTELARKKKVQAIWPGRAWEVNGKSKVMIYGDLPFSVSLGGGVLFNFGWGPDLYEP